jgi:ArsR family transcriptional regulator, arsenate/arsenite/antimonite-responsive transcriptional repressor
MSNGKSKPVFPSPEKACRGLADATRLRLLAKIGRGDVCVCDLQAEVKRDQPTVSRHLAMLRKCGLVTVRKEGRWSYYRRAPLPPGLSKMVDLAAKLVKPKPGGPGCC